MKSYEIKIPRLMTGLILEELIEFCKSGDRKAQRELYEYTYAKLLNASQRYTQGNEEAQWVFNHAMLKVFSNLENYEKNTNYLAWARTIIVKTAIDYLRKRIREDKMVVPIEAHSHDMAVQEINTVLSQLETEAIIGLVQSLPDKERLVFSLYEIDGYSHVDIEKECNINQNTSKWLLAKAKKVLRKKVSEIYQLKKSANE